MLVMHEELIIEFANNTSLIRGMHLCSDCSYIITFYLKRRSSVLHVSCVHQLPFRSDQRIAPLFTVLPLQGPAVVIKTCPFHVPTQSSFVLIPSMQAAKILYFSTWDADIGEGAGRPSMVTTSPIGAPSGGSTNSTFSEPSSLHSAAHSTIPCDLNPTRFFACMKAR